MLKFTPKPGSYIAEEIESKGLLVLDSKKQQIKKGRVVAVGEDEISDYGVKIPVPVKVGDIVHFLSYAGEYDQEIINGKTYYSVLSGDHRFITNE